ncbi:MAG: hypothetical protein ACM3OA_00725 [Acidobacteriota bacterium]|jgi:hypothetical protein|nr:hypothetical protein [Casimicrobiaceae bacterium]
MSRTLALYVAAFDRSMSGTAVLRSLVRSLRRLARQHALALTAAVEAEQPRKGQKRLRGLYIRGA